MKSIGTFLSTVTAAFLATSSSVFAAICDPGVACEVPEPGSLALVAVAIVGVALVARKKK